MVVSKVQPTAIVKIVDPNGQVVEENSIQEKRVVDEKDAAIITKHAESVISGGTGGNAATGRPAAGKQVQQMIPRMLGSLVIRLIS